MGMIASVAVVLKFLACSTCLCWFPLLWVSKLRWPFLWETVGGILASVPQFRAGGERVGIAA